MTQNDIEIVKEQEAQQAQTVADIKRNHRTEKGLNKLAMAHHDRGQLLKIVDSQAQKIAELQARAPKQYTEAELREGFASQYQDGLHVGENGEFTDRQIEADFAEWVECARFLGAIKDTHAEPIT